MKCGMPVTHRYTWPGKNETYCCLIHAVQLRNVAAAMGLYLQLIPLGVQDYLNARDELVCQNEVENKGGEVKHAL